MNEKRAANLPPACFKHLIASAASIYRCPELNFGRSRSSIHPERTITN